MFHDNTLNLQSFILLAMDLTEFITSFSRVFEQTDPSHLTESTDFKNLEEWGFPNRLVRYCYGR